MNVPPRSGAVVAWCRALAAGPVSARRAADAIRGSDALHVLTWPDRPDAIGWVEALDLLGRSVAGGAVLALPVPGDPAGLAGPGDLLGAAIEAGEAAVFPGAGLVLVPQVQGTSAEPVVVWRVMPCAVPVAGAAPDLPEADRRLRRAILTAGQDLDDLGLETTRPDALRRLEDVDRALADQALPPLPPRALTVLRTSGRLLAAVDMALEDEGAALTAGEARDRRAAVSALGGSCRRALEAAYAAVAPPAPEPERRPRTDASRGRR